MKKLILWFAGILLILIIAAVALPFIFKDKILERVKSEINNNVNAKVNFSDFDLTLLTSFPDFTLSLDQVVVTGLGDFNGDTLTSIEKLAVGADLMSIIKGGTIVINGITLNKPYVNLLVLKNGKANWDIAKADSGSSAAGEESTSFKMSLDHYEINEGLIRYSDDSSGMKALVNNLNHSGNGDFSEKLFTLSTKTTIDALDFWYGGIRYLTRTKTALNADLEMDMVNSKYTFKDNELSLNELVLGFDGYVAMPGEDIMTDVKFNAKKTEFRNFISLVPGVYQEGFKDLKSSGKMALDGFVKGIYNEKKMPSFGLNVLVQNGMFQYPSLPAAVNNVQMDLKILNRDGIPDHTVIDMTRLHAELASEPFDAKLLVRTPVSDADIDLFVKGKINLANISKIVPMEKGSDLNGILDIDLTAKGRMSAIEQKKYDQFNAAGHVVVSNMKYASEDFKNGVFINTFDLAFSPSTVTLNRADIKTGKSDLQANGRLDNLLSYLFKDQTLTGSLNITSKLLDINEMMGEEAKSGTPSPADTAPGTVLEIPEKINFTVNANITKVLYDNMEMNNMKGEVILADQQLSMKNLTFNMLEGLVAIKGSYNSRNKKKPEMDLNLDISNADIQKTVKTFNTVRTLAPVAERCNGRYGASVSLSTSLDEQMNPVLSTLNGAGRLTTGQVVLTNFEVLNKLADAVKLNQLKQVNLSNVNISFSFKDGRVNVDPFDVNLAGVKTTIQGSNGFDQTIDYTLAMQIPKSMLGTQANSLVSGLLGQANAAAGTNLSVPDPVKVKANIGGTVSKPVIKTGLGEKGGSITEGIKDKAKEEFDKKKQELEDKARAEADKLKKEAEDKARAEADRLKKEAEKKAKKEAEDKVKDLFKKPK